MIKSLTLPLLALTLGTTFQMPQQEQKNFPAVKVVWESCQLKNAPFQRQQKKPLLQPEQVGVESIFSGILAEEFSFHQ